MQAKLNIVILAAGKGTRMFSRKPKVLHEVAGKPILRHVVDCAKVLNPAKIIVVYGFGGDLVKNAFNEEIIIWAEQKEQLGTGHAVQQATPHLDDDANTLILLGDVPLINAEACKKLLTHANQQLAILSFNKADPTGYGRIIRDAKNSVTAIIEQKDATEAHRKINEINTGIMAMPAKALKNWLAGLSNNNAQKEYYLTDIVALAVQDKFCVTAEIADDEWSITGINSKQDLAQIERVYQQRYAEKLLKKGVTLADPARIDVRGTLETAQDVEIDVGCVFEGNVHLGENVKIGAYCVIKDTSIAANTTIAPFTHIVEASVGENNSVGPFARLRPGTALQADVHIGNFVELKNAQVDSQSSINHLSYVGDSIVGKRVNIGAGTITCNYDGANKHRTVIEDDVFVGSDTQLIAPVTVEKGATIGAGSTISKTATAGELTISRAKQITIKGWKRPSKEKKV
ncbi:MAG: bifunctional UDP-N-acetylglucosamine diphosphorylase/glucosamine-1-phosphate N-acetyltransferase GlmU [Methylophilaceae bacterium]